MAKSNGSGSMAALQEGRSGEFAGGEVRGGGPAGASTPKSSASGLDKFHNRPKSSKGTEFSMDAAKTDGLSK